MKRNLISAAMAALLFSAAASAAPAAAQAAPPKTKRESRTVQFGALKGPGWGHAKVKRMALKKRNQARNRRAHRGQA